MTITESCLLAALLLSLLGGIFLGHRLAKANDLIEHLANPADRTDCMLCRNGISHDWRHR